MYAKEHNNKYMWFRDCKLFLRKDKTNKAILIEDENCLYNTNYFLSISEFIKKFNFSNNKSVLMISVNVRSINANIDELLLYLKNDSYFNLDIIVLTETWRNPENCIHNIPGYKLFYSTKKRNQNVS